MGPSVVVKKGPQLEIESTEQLPRVGGVPGYMVCLWMVCQRGVRSRQQMLVIRIQEIRERGGIEHLSATEEGGGFRREVLPRLDG